MTAHKSLCFKHYIFVICISKYFDTILTPWRDVNWTLLPHCRGNTFDKRISPKLQRKYIWQANACKTKHGRPSGSCFVCVIRYALLNFFSIKQRESHSVGITTKDVTILLHTTYKHTRETTCVRTRCFYFKLCYVSLFSRVCKHYYIKITIKFNLVFFGKDYN